MYGDYKTDISFMVVPFYGSTELHKGRNQLILEHFGNVKIDHLHSSLWHSETEWDDAMCMH